MTESLVVVTLLVIGMAAELQRRRIVGRRVERFFASQRPTILRGDRLAEAAEPPAGTTQPSQGRPAA